MIQLGLNAEGGRAAGREGGEELSETWAWSRDGRQAYSGKVQAIEDGVGWVGGGLGGVLWGL